MKKGGLSSAAKIGIGVGLGVAFFLIIIYLVFLWLRRSRGISLPKLRLGRPRGISLLKLGSRSSHINPQAAIPQIEVKDHISEGSVAQEFVRELECDLSDAGRYSSQETLLGLEELKQRPLADLQGQGVFVG